MESQHDTTSGTVQVRRRIDLDFWSDLDPEVADLDAESHVGQAVFGLLVHLQSVANTQAVLESELVDLLKQIGIRQSSIWLFG
ncbi:hypothetical protein [Burkholderia sp. Ac-20353]|uniref:hypothetical protein n=1 Tax=Burkholderia sp. Ac-20353 TaxID=2703894 RepID=UPI00197B0C6D|nr:hypothetical protein [Burkholderia sp. Ac-20353]MBN3785507.1 hypothetical protein [Burkholderia sp. Ac-20353]